jgi:glycosyltransferase involved in cell wall biosynthesis
MKIVIVTSGLFKHTGGPPVVIANLIRQLNQFKGLEIMYLGVDGDIHEDVIKLKSLVGYEDFQVKTPYRISFRFLKELCKFKPDLVWVHGMWLWPNFIGIMYSFFTRKKLIVTPHGVLTKPMFSIRWYKKMFFGFFDLLVLILKRNITLHYLSDSERNECILKGFGKMYNIIPNFVHVKTINMERPKNSFIYLARIAPIKGIEDLLQIPNLLCDIYGFGDKKYIDTVLGDRNNFKGTVSNSEVGILFSQYMFYLLPSYGEGLPTSAIEAAMAGCILVVSNQCNLNMFIHNKDVIKFNAGKENLEAAINQAKSMSDSELYEMRQSSLKIVNEYFSETILVNKYKDLVLK